MGKNVGNDVLDAALNEIATATVMHACSGTEPTTYAEAVAASLADVTPTFTGPADGDTSGRKITVDQKTGVTVDVTGDATHVCLVDASVLLYTTTCTTQSLTATNTMTFNSWDIEIADPT